MSADDLYQEVILDHFKNPRHARVLRPEEVRIEKLNPSCGDRIRIGYELQDGTFQTLTCELQACAIAVASASMMADALQNKPVEELAALHPDVVALLSGDLEPGPDLGDLSALVAVSAFPVRIPCALLPWRALEEALSDGAEKGTG